MTVLTGLSSERKLGGLAVMSGWTPMRKTLKAVSLQHPRRRHTAQRACDRLLTGI